MTVHIELTERETYDLISLLDFAYWTLLIEARDEAILIRSKSITPRSEALGPTFEYKRSIRVVKHLAESIGKQALHWQTEE